MTFVKIANIGDLGQTPRTSDPNHPHVSAILIIYSFDSFLFYRLNQKSRIKDMTIVDSLGPYAVALSRIIDSIQTKRSDKI